MGLCAQRPLTVPTWLCREPSICLLPLCRRSVGVLGTLGLVLKHMRALGWLLCSCMLAYAAVSESTHSMAAASHRIAWRMRRHIACRPHCMAWHMSQRIAWQPLPITTTHSAPHGWLLRRGQRIAFGRPSLVNQATCYRNTWCILWVAATVGLKALHRGLQY